MYLLLCQALSSCHSASRLAPRAGGCNFINEPQVSSPRLMRDLTARTILVDTRVKYARAVNGAPPVSFSPGRFEPGPIES